MDSQIESAEEAGKSLDKFEKAAEIKAAVYRIDRVLKKVETPRILFRGGPGVGKSTASYELLKHLEETRGLTSIWVQSEELGGKSLREKIRHAPKGQIIFIDSIDSVLIDGDDVDGVAATVNLLRDLASTGEGPMIVANIHDPYLIKKGTEQAHDKVSAIMFGDEGLFADAEQYVLVEDEFSSEKSRGVALVKAMGEAGIDPSWTRNITDHLNRLGISKHSEMTSLLSGILLKMKDMQLPGELRHPYSKESKHVVAEWMKDWLVEVRAQNEKFNRAYYRPDSDEEAYKGLVRVDVLPDEAEADEQVVTEVESDRKVDDESAADEGEKSGQKSVGRGWLSRFRKK